MESDPTGLGGGLNTYGYAQGSPAVFIDTLGLAIYRSGNSFADTLFLSPDCLEAAQTKDFHVAGWVTCSPPSNRLRDNPCARIGSNDNPFGPHDNSGPDDGSGNDGNNGLPPLSPFTSTPLGKFLRNHPDVLIPSKMFIDALSLGVTLVCPGCEIAIHLRNLTDLWSLAEGDYWGPLAGRSSEWALRPRLGDKNAACAGAIIGAGF